MRPIRSSSKQERKQLFGPPKNDLLIYILELQDGCFYVGKTKKQRFDQRMEQHNNPKHHKAVAWVKRHGFKKVIYQKFVDDAYEQDKYVKMMMSIKGIDKVRGGSYSQIDITSEQIKIIQKQIKGAQDLCFKCGGHHYAQKCRQAQELVQKASIARKYLNVETPTLQFRKINMDREVQTQFKVSNMIRAQGEQYVEKVFNNFCGFLYYRV